MQTPYPTSLDLDAPARIKKALALIKNQAALNDALAYLSDDRVIDLERRIIKNCEAISDINEAYMPEWHDLRAVGIELYEIGGYLLMKVVCDCLAQTFADLKKRTPKGNSYGIGSNCNGAWGMIGEWVS